MKIGLLSDTHIPSAAFKLPDAIAKHFAEVDLIMHAGDIFTLRVLDDLQRIAPVIAARGDGDAGEVLADPRVRWKHVLSVNGKTIWLIHEMPYPYPVPLWHARSRDAHQEFTSPDIVVFGHDHCTIVQRIADVLLVNPGSPTFLNYRKGPGTLGLLEIDHHDVKIKIIEMQPMSAPA